MRLARVTGVCLLLVVAGTMADEALAQEHTFRLVDFVELPRDLDAKFPEMLAENCCDFEFHETWRIFPEKSILQKSVIEYTLLQEDAAKAISDSVQHGFPWLVAHLPLVKGYRQLRNISYELMLLDPHFTELSKHSGPDPGSLDSLSRELQELLIELIPPGLRNGNLYNYDEQMLSVRFHETWNIDPSTLEITKLVQGITPVIWQRRQSVTGEPVNEADTGLPVYYKIQLNRINLRNQ